MSAAVEAVPDSAATFISPFALKVHPPSVQQPSCDDEPHNGGKAVYLNGHVDHAGPPADPPLVRADSASDSGPPHSTGTPVSGAQNSDSTPGSSAQQQQQSQHRPRTGFRDLFHNNASDAADADSATSSYTYTASGGIAAALRTAMRRTTGLNGSQDGSVVKVFPNGDRYVGQWKDGQPDGTGRYEWVDGSMYDGRWKLGQKDGVGEYQWPSGAVYRGEWRDGFMHGTGTMQGPDGSVFTGGWNKDIKHGLGRKVYSNGDVYEGLWKGRPSGPGRYRWKTGNEYDGEWRDGRMHGQGTLKWATGERYDGEWANGQENGIGTFTWPDGSTFHGYWEHGKKNGVGVYRSSDANGKRATGSTLDRPINLSMPDGSGHSISGRESLEQPNTPPSVASSVVIREYKDGTLLREDAISQEHLEAIFGPMKDAAKKRRIRKAKTKISAQPGESIYKGHRSYDLMLNLQLGIRFSVGSITSKPVPNQLSDSDFRRTEKLYFPREGSKETPPHPSGNFTFKDYMPMAFRKLRQIFAIDAGDYMMSICGDNALRELPSPGKSGSVFWISHDDRFFLKTMKRGEVELLLKLLPRYYAHVERYPHTLLIKFFGLHRVKPASGGKMRVVVMNNLFQNQSGMMMHRKYDLKGSTQGRFSGKAPDSGAILKDLDLDVSLKLPEDWHARLTAQLEADCALLESLRVMDYSLLLGIHYRSGGHHLTPLTTDREDTEEEPETPHGSRSPTRGGGASALSRAFSSGLVGRSASLEVPGTFPGTPTVSARGLSTTGVRFSGLTGDDRMSSGELGPQQGRRRAGSADEALVYEQELARIHREMQRRFGDQLSEKRIEDLVRLAGYKMLGRVQRTGRNPSAVLSARLARSDTMRPLGDAERTDELAQSLGQPYVHLGMNMPAVALHDMSVTAPEDVIIWFGIIDILQEYNVTKRVEHRWKSLVHDGSTISAVSPQTYSRRFQAFLKKVFV